MARGRHVETERGLPSRVSHKVTFSAAEDEAIRANLKPRQSPADFIRRATLEAVGIRVEEVPVHWTHDYRAALGQCGKPGKVTTREHLVTCPACRTLMEG